MRAFALEQFGGPGSLQEVPDPRPGAGELLVRVRASSLNAMDWKVGKGYVKDFMEHRFPLVLGLDFAGAVEDLGQGVADFEPGQAVFGAAGKPVMGSGTLAELATVSAATAVAKPASIEDRVAATLPTAGCTALMGVEAVQPSQGDAVLVVGAAGGVGSFAVQLAASRGADVIGVATSSNADYVRELGASELIDYTSEDLVEAVRRRRRSGLAAIIDLVSDAATLGRLSELVRDGGVIVSALSAAPAEGAAPRGIRGVNLGGTVNRERLQALASAVEQGELKPPAIKTFSLQQAAEALLEAQSGHVRGKLVVTVS